MYLSNTTSTLETELSNIPKTLLVIFAKLSNVWISWLAKCLDECMTINYNTTLAHAFGSSVGIECILRFLVTRSNKLNFSQKFISPLNIAKDNGPGDG